MTDALQATEVLGASGASAPRVALEDIKNKIAEQYYFTAGEAVRALAKPEDAALDVLTLCVLKMDNGFIVIGKSAPASPENFDAEKGRTFAFEDAIRQLWPLMGFALRERLSADDA